MEEWKTIKDFPNYSVSNLGRIRRDKRGNHTQELKILKLSLDKFTGYLFVCLMKNKKRNVKRVHSLVIMTFKKINKNKDIDHINGNKLDNRLENLQIISHAENIRKSKDIKLTRLEVIYIIKEYIENSVTQTQLAKKYHVHLSTINKILTGTRWKNRLKYTPTMQNVI